MVRYPSLRCQISVVWWAKTKGSSVFRIDLQGLFRVDPGLKISVWGGSKKGYRGLGSRGRPEGLGALGSQM